MEAPEDYQVDALIRLLDAAATRRRPPCQRDKVAAAGAARDPGSWVATRDRGGRRSGEVRTMRTLSAEGCVACRRDSPQVTEAEIPELRREVPDWHLVERDGIARLERVFDFPTFAAALVFTNGVGALAEEEGHHPTLVTEWGRVTVTWWTHKIRGLHRNDFVMAAKTDALVAESGHIRRDEIREGRAPVSRGCSGPR